MFMPRVRPHDTALIGAVLAALTGVAWAYTIYLASNGSSMDMGAMTAGHSLTMGMTASLFIVMWVAMMAAMMFPTVVPMVTMFTTVHRYRGTRASTYVPTWVFLAGYFMVWAATAFPAYLFALAADEVAVRAPGLSEAGPYVGGAILIAAGLYQMTPYKDICLKQCRSPLGFLMTSWREGYRGALRMGLEHGIFCLGCCWVLFLILFTVGVMNVAWMGGLAALIFLEKVTPHGVAIGRLAAVLLVVAGSIMVVDRGLLPGL